MPPRSVGLDYAGCVSYIRAVLEAERGCRPICGGPDYAVLAREGEGSVVVLAGEERDLRLLFRRACVEARAERPIELVVLSDDLNRLVGLRELGPTRVTLLGDATAEHEAADPDGPPGVGEFLAGHLGVRRALRGSSQDQRPGQTGGRPERWMERRRPVVTWVLIGVCTALHLLRVLAGWVGLDPAPAAWGGLVTPIVGLLLPWTLLSAGFLHVDAVHLLVNMLSLRGIGIPLEEALGRGRFLVLYLLSVLGGSLCSLFLSMGVHVGASTGLWGLLAATWVFAYRHPELIGHARAEAHRQAFRGVLILNVLFSCLPGISFTGHLGGGVTGAALMLSGLGLAGLKDRRGPQLPGWMSGGAWLLSVLAGLCVCAAVCTGLSWNVVKPLLPPMEGVEAGQGTAPPGAAEGGAGR